MHQQVSRWAQLAILMVLSGTAAAQGGTRVLFSHYAPDVGPVSLHDDQGEIVGTLAYGETDSRYRPIEGGEVNLMTWVDAEIVTSTDFVLGDGDYSVFLHPIAGGGTGLAVARDTLAAFDFPAPFDFETADANAAGRFLSFAIIDDGASSPMLEALAGRFWVEADGSLTPSGGFETEFSVGTGPVVGTDYHATVNGGVVYQVEIDVGAGRVTGSFDQPAGTTDYVLIGTGDVLELIERPRPGARSLFVDGLYGEPGINGSGLKLFELRGEGRVFGFLYSYDESGAPTWYYLDSRCDLERGFQCTTPGFLVGSGSYIVALYRVDGGALSPGVEGELEIVGAGRLRVARQSLVPPGFVGDQETLPVADLFFYLEPPPGEGLPPFPTDRPPDARFVFEKLRF